MENKPLFCLPIFISAKILTLAAISPGPRDIDIDLSLRWDSVYGGIAEFKNIQFENNS
ncbi:MAG: hypothetical protein HFF83_01795 [Oscillibacter sp.]|jgi:hypothetical protein|nr:hypothetical protein [Oscillibacter sp.]